MKGIFLYFYIRNISYIFLYCHEYIWFDYTLINKINSQLTDNFFIPHIRFNFIQEDVNHVHTNFVESDREAEYRDRLVDVCKEIIEEHELNKMSDDVWGDEEWGFYITVDDEPEYDGAGFIEDDRIVNGEYRVINNNNSANNEV